MVSNREERVTADVDSRRLLLAEPFNLASVPVVADATPHEEEKN